MDDARQLKHEPRRRVIRDDIRLRRRGTTASGQFYPAQLGEDVLQGHGIQALGRLALAFVAAFAAYEVLLFAFALRVSRSYGCALVVALLQVAMAPRFYNHPKLLAYALAMPARSIKWPPRPA